MAADYLPRNFMEGIVNTLSDNLSNYAPKLAEGAFGSGQPPFTRKLTEQEQLQQYLAMDGPKWLAMMQTAPNGAKDALRYSAAMLKLYQKYNGPIQPGMAIMSGPPTPAEMPLGSPDPRSPQNQPSPLGGAGSGDGDMRQLAQQMPADPHSVQQIIQQAMSRVGGG